MEDSKKKSDIPEAAIFPTTSDVTNKRRAVTSLMSCLGPRFTWDVYEYTSSVIVLFLECSIQKVITKCASLKHYGNTVSGTTQT